MGHLMQAQDLTAVLSKSLAISTYEEVIGLTSLSRFTVANACACP